VFVCSEAIILRILIFILNNLTFNKFSAASRMRTELRLLKCNASNIIIWGSLDNDPNRKKTSANKLDKKCYTVSLSITALSHTLPGHPVTGVICRDTI
jgi:hypothetical protein